MATNKFTPLYIIKVNWKITMSFKVPRSISKHYRSFGRADGFTFVEVMVILVIGIILVKTAVPLYSSFILTQQSVSEANNLFNDLQYTRSEAVREGQFVSMCVSSNGTSCTGGTWDSGWIIYSNPSFTAAAPNYVSGTSILLRVYQGSANPLTSVTTNPTRTVVTYNRNGFAVGLNATTAPVGLLFTISNTPTTLTAATRCLWLDVLGRQYIQKSGQTAATGQGTNICL